MREGVNVPEAQEQEKFVRWCQANGYYVRKLTSVGRKGWPDLFVGNPRSKKHMYVEMKYGHGRVSALQRATHETMRQCGVVVMVAFSATDAQAMVYANLGTP
jgi:hypothetical protein